jgi:superfamily II DNA or RNA helicase
MKEYIYILQVDFIQQNIKDCCKIGSTRNLSNRISSYKTYYPIFCNANTKCTVYEYENEKYSCYFIDELLKVICSKYNNPFEKYTNIGGTEYYIYNTSNKFDKLLDLLEINFKKYDVNVEDLFTSYDKKTELKELSNDIDMSLLNETIKQFKKKINIKQIELKEWQNDAKTDFIDFLKGDEKSGVLIAPTAAGKTFLFCILALEYIRYYKKDVLIITKKIEIFHGLKRRIDNFLKMCNYSNITVYDLINDKSKDYSCLDSQSSGNNIYIINSDKFVSSSRFNDYKNYSFGKIKLVIQDECHWSGSEKIYDFFTYLKNRIVDKVLGLSATPSRILEINKERTFDIYGNNDELNVIFQRGILEAINDNDIVAPKWSFFNVDNNDIIIDCKKDEDGIKRSIYKLNKIGNEKMVKYIENILDKSVYKKGILWFRSRKDVVDFCEFIDENKMLNTIKLFPSFSNSSKESDNIIERCKKLGITQECINNNIEYFKEEDSDAILLVVFRATEGFDDPKLDFGIRMYLGQSIDPLLEYQRMGRLTRTYENKTTVNYITIEMIDNEVLRTSFVKRLADWVKFISDFTQKTRTLKKNKVIDKSTVDIMDSFFDFNIENMKSIDIKSIKNDIIKLNVGSNIKKFINKENKKRYNENKELILSKNQCFSFLQQYDLVINEEPVNWIKYCLGNKLFDKFKTKYYYDKHELEEACMKLEICDLDDYKLKCCQDKKLPSIEYVNNGFYQDLDQKFNLSLLISSVICDCEF